MPQIEHQLLARLPYGSEGCTCGTHGTPSKDCNLHRPVYLAERVQDAVARHAFENGTGHDVGKVSPADYPAHYERIQDAFVEAMPLAFALTPREGEAMEHINEAMNIIVNEWKLDPESYNLRIELTTAVHAMQGFVVQHMLQRMGVWGAWYLDMPSHKTEVKDDSA